MITPCEEQLLSLKKNKKKKEEGKSKNKKQKKWLSHLGHRQPEGPVAV